MHDPNKLRIQMARILNMGTLLSLLLVMAGGLILLYQHGHESIDSFISSPTRVTFNITSIVSTSFSALSLIEAGLLVIVATQLLRMILLVIFYYKTHDHVFTFFSLFIACVMLLSFFS